MAQAQDPAAYVYQGIWTNWTRGSSTWGLTLTLHPDNAVLVTSSLAVFVTLAGSQLWTIVRFTLHQTGSRPQPVPSTPNHTKQQVILRNAPTDLSTARLMAYIAWFSRGKQGKVSPRAICISVFALVHAILFMVAGTFSNLAISAGSPIEGTAVLSRSKHCGTWDPAYFDVVAAGNNPETDETLAMSNEYITKAVANAQLSVEYARKCYLSQQTSGQVLSACNVMKKPRLKWTNRSNESCPFGGELCDRESNVIVYETETINSHHHLGINAKPEDRLDYRRITSCAVLNDTNLVRDWDGAIDTEGDVFERKTAHAFYGPSTYKGTEWTYAYSNFAALYDNFTVQVTTPYQVDAELAYAAADPAWSVSDFEPISELQQESADLILFFLSFSGMYLEETDDPWFSAHRKREFSNAPPIMQERFARDAAISTIGCTEQHQFCTSDGVCTPYGGFDQVQNDASFNAALDGHRNATFDRMLRAVTSGGMKEVVEKLSVTNSPLLAVNEIATGSTVVSLPLPIDQWERELTYWHSIAMAQMQRTVVQWSSGQISPDPKYLLKPVEEQDKWFCQNQLIPSTVYQSFSIMSIILIAIFGTLVIVISLNIEALARVLRRCLRRSKPRKDWDNDDMLKLPGSFRDSVWKPRPPPKDKHPATPSTLYSGASPSKKAPMKTPPSTGTSIDNEMGSWTRSSSPTLPPADRSIPAITISPVPCETSHLTPHPIHRVDRDSWMAISLNGLDTTSVPIDTSGESPREHKRTSISLPDIGNSPTMQRLRNPMHFHVPRPPGSWI